jgi:TPR repeat protein
LHKDDREAARLYKLAADHGNPSGQVSLENFYRQGRGGLRKDGREAGRLYRLAADQGNQLAKDKLAELQKFITAS